MIGFNLAGPKITKMVAFSPWTRQWVTQDLKEPVSGQLSPALYPGVILCPIGRFYYTYSVEADKWAALELKRPIVWDQPGGNGRGGSPRPKDGKIIIPEADVIHTYDVKTGEWTHIDTKDDK
jgi:hypothetical protein